MLFVIKGLLHKSQLLEEGGCVVLNPAGKHFTLTIVSRATSL